MGEQIGRTGKRRLELEEEGRYIATKIKKMLPPGSGFTLLLFDLGGPGNMVYMSSAVREDMIEALKELIGNLESEVS